MTIGACVGHTVSVATHEHTHTHTNLTTSFSLEAHTRKILSGRTVQRMTPFETPHNSHLYSSVGPNCSTLHMTW